MQIDRQDFYRPEEILQDVRDKVEKTREAGEAIDYLTFVPDGEPTLDIALGQEIAMLRPLGIPIAVITNASLIWREDVRRDLGQADWVSLKVDSTREVVWSQVNRPHGMLQLASVLEGMLQFARTYRGELVTETMLVRDVNDQDEYIEELADYLVQLRPTKAYLAIPTRPPAEKWVAPPDEETINRAYQILNAKVDSIEYLIGYEGDAFTFTGDVEEDLLSITAVHPMRERAVKDFLARAQADWSAIEKLIGQEQIIEIHHEGAKFYMRKLH
jgi:wyosine [tRNA(Phe)-imidazoG37] synthetase (radical SAM superfamily)